ncbi:MAG: polysaccharide biosynthesis/export family protein, partial [Marinomonas sp.]
MPILYDTRHSTVSIRSVLILLALLVSGCASSPAPIVGAVASAPVNQLGQANYTPVSPATYAMRAGDVISVNVFREEALSADSLVIGAGGMVSLPLIGSIKAEGLTANALEANVTQRLREEYLRRPAVNVNITDYKSHRVTVEGAVKEPGVYAFQPGDRLSSAIALARGNERTADLSDMAVFREFGGEMAVARFD